MQNDKSPDQPSHGTVEQLLASVETIDAATSSVGIWIPRNLTYNGQPIPQREGIDRVHAAVIAKGFEAREHHSAKNGSFHIFDRSFDC